MNEDNSYRIRTEVGNVEDKYITLKMEQQYKALNILSLTVNQEDIYKSFSSDYGVVVGRIIGNGGTGLPNVKVSIFIPVDDIDINNPEVFSLYPFKRPKDVNSRGTRYNLLNKFKKLNPFSGWRSNIFGIGYSPKTPVGTFPSKEEILTNPTQYYIYDKYYKFTTTTNASGDFMLFGVPVGQQTLHVDCDLTDIGKYSMSPVIMQKVLGYQPQLFEEEGTKVKDSDNLNELAHIITQDLSINVRPFWSNVRDLEVGITRQDVSINANIVPSTTFVGSAFTMGEDSFWGNYINFQFIFGLRIRMLSLLELFGINKSDVQGRTFAKICFSCGNDCNNSNPPSNDLHRPFSEYLFRICIRFNINFDTGLGFSFDKTFTLINTSLQNPIYLIATTLKLPDFSSREDIEAGSQVISTRRVTVNNSIKDFSPEARIIQKYVGQTLPYTVKRLPVFDVIFNFVLFSFFSKEINGGPDDRNNISISLDLLGIIIPRRDRRTENTNKLDLENHRIGDLEIDLYTINPETKISNDIVSGTVNSTIQRMDENQYGLFTDKGVYAMVIPCNRNRVITDEFGNEIPSSNDQIGILTEFWGHHFLEMVDLPIKDPSGKYVSERTFVKIPQSNRLENENDIGNFMRNFYRLKANEYYTTSYFFNYNDRRNRNLSATLNTTNTFSFGTFHLRQVEVQCLDDNNGSNTVTPGDNTFTDEWLHGTVYLPQFAYRNKRRRSVVESRVTRFTRDNNFDFGAGRVNSKFLSNPLFHVIDYVKLSKEDIGMIIERSDYRKRKGLKIETVNLSSDFNVKNQENNEFKAYIFRGLKESDIFHFLIRKNLL